MRLYTFLSQIFDYGNTGIEKQAIFYKRLLLLLEFGRDASGNALHMHQVLDDQAVMGQDAITQVIK